MMKFAVIFAMMIWLVHSQRPPYAGSTNRWPAVLPQYTEGKEPANTVNSIGNRIDAGQDTANRLPSIGAASSSSSTDIPLDLPVDALGDIELINRIKTWPREKWPFWFLNWQQIQEHRGDSNNRGQVSAVQPNTRSFFAG